MTHAKLQRDGKDGGSMKRTGFLALLLGVAALVGGFAPVARGNKETVDGVVWTYRVSDGKASLGGGSYRYPAVPQSTTGAISIPIELGGYPVVEIGAEAFYGCRSLTRVTIPGNVTNIGNYVFKDCSSLTNIMIPDSVASIGNQAFFGCSSLTSVTIPSNITSIGEYVFRDCSSLTNVTIPDSVTSIEYGAFFSCSSLTSVTIPDSVTDIGGSAFCACSSLTSVTIPGSVTSIGAWAFSDCSGLTNVTIPDSVTNIEVRAFSGCSALKAFSVADGNPAYQTVAGLLLTKDGQTLVGGVNGDVVIPNSVTSIGAYAFSGCSSLTSVTIPDSVAEIGGCAFSGCSSLTSVTIPGSVTSIDGEVFAGCSGLTSVTIPGSVTSIGWGAFRNCTALTGVVIPGSVTSIDEEVFAGCSGLTSVTIPVSVTNIEISAFDGCSALEAFSVADGNPAYQAVSGLLLTKDGKTLIKGVNGDVMIPDGVTGIGGGAFCGYSGLTSVTIPESVTFIGEWAFYRCSSLTAVTIPPSVTDIEEGAFAGCTALEVLCLPLSEMDWVRYIFGTEYVYARIIGGGCSESIDGAVWYYTVNDNQATVCFGPQSGNVDIPSVLGGCPVTSIGDYALGGCWICFDGDWGWDTSELTGVTIPDSVTNIGDYAFARCHRLASVTIPSSVTHIGEYAFLGCSELASVTISDCMMDIGYGAFCDCTALTGVVIPESVTRINGEAFYGCSNLTSVVIPDSVTSIDGGAFYGCSGLTSVMIPDTVTSIGSDAFSHCSSSLYDTTSKPGVLLVDGWAVGAQSPSGDLDLTGIRGIADYAFADCSELTSVTIPGSVTTIGDHSFAYCHRLGSVTISGSVTHIGEYAFVGCSGLTSVTISGSVTSIGWGAFRECTGLTGIVIPGNVTSIDGEVFAGCSGLTSVTIPGSVTSIGWGAFRECTGLTGVVIPGSVTSIDEEVFAGCSGLTSVMIPDTVTSIGNDAFSGCSSSLYDTTRKPGVLLVDGWAVGAQSPSGDLDLTGIRGVADCAFTNCSELTSVTIPGNVTSVGRSAFSGCSGLRWVSIHLGGTGIGYHAFSECTGLQELYVPSVWAGTTKVEDAGVGSECRVFYHGLEVVDGVEWAFEGSNGQAVVIEWPQSGNVAIPSALGGLPLAVIDERAFYGCSGLTGVTVPESVTSIGAEAFKGCSGLARVTILGPATAVGNDAFSGSGLQVLVVPMAWKGTGKLSAAGVPSGCRVVYGRPEFVEGVEWVYDVGNGQATVTDVLATSGVVSVPAVLGGCPVTAIGERAFGAATGLTGVTLPDSVRRFGDYAFAGCRGLATLAISDLTTYIGREAFSGCAGLTSVVILDSAATIGNNAFSGSGLRMLEVPAAWKGTDKLKNAGVPSGCTVTYRESSLSITPATRKFGVDGGPGAIVTSGSGMWKAAASASWITLNTASGRAGYPVAYLVAATTEVEPRTGTITVNGQVHTVTQDGLGGSITPTNATFERLGGTGTVSVTAPEGVTWHAKANAGWLQVGNASGKGPGTLSYTVAAFEEVNTRQGTLTVAGNTFTVFQYGRRMKLASTSTTQDYYTHVIPITVEALSITEWAVKPNAGWISVVDAGTGKGSGLVTIAISENPSWKARTGTVTIGTETFTVTQQGRTALEFAISPSASSASVNGANGVIAVTATPDLPWSAASGANWLTVYEATAQGAGNGNVVYSASPNPTLYDRTGSITVTPGDAKVSAQTHRVTQAAAASALSLEGCEFAAAGENHEVRVSLADIVQWQIENTNWWLKVLGETNLVGPATVTLQAEPNGTVHSRSGTVTLARKTFRVAQLGRNVEVSYDTKLFGPEGGGDTIQIHPDGNVSWTAEASDPTWITIWGGNYGTGEGEVMYIVSPYVGDGEARTGTITVGDKVIYITQRPYDLSIAPTGAQVEGNNGAGEFGVSAGIADVWTAIATEPWITIIEGYDPATGNGTVRFAYTDNDTGKTRTGKIIVAGEVYTLEQQARQLVAITAESGRGGTVSGGGTYDLGAEVTLKAVPGSGYAFSRWTGDVTSTANPLKLTADAPKLVTAVFKTKSLAFKKVVSGPDGVSLEWNNLAWAMTYRLLRGTTDDVSAAAVLAEIPNTGTCTWLDETGEPGVEYRYWVEAVGVQDNVRSKPATGKKTFEWPSVRDDAEVVAALSGAADPRLAAHLKTVTDYDAFRQWAEASGLAPLAVRASAHAWPSYLLGAETLFANEPTIRIDGIGFGDGATRDADGDVALEIRVTVQDGENTVAVDAAKVAAMFEITANPANWSGEGRLPATSTQTGRDGDVLLYEVAPGDGLEGKAFLRLAL